MSYLSVTFNNVGDYEGSTTTFDFVDQSSLDQYLQEYGSCYDGYTVVVVDGDLPA